MGYVTLFSQFFPVLNTFSDKSFLSYFNYFALLTLSIYLSSPVLANGFYDVLTLGLYKLGLKVKS